MPKFDQNNEEEIELILRKLGLDDVVKKNDEENESYLSDEYNDIVSISIYLLFKTKYY